MKLATTAVPRTHLPAWPAPSSAALYRIAGLSIAAGVPTVFWTVMLMLVANGFGIAIGTPALAAFGLIVAALCFVGAAIVMGNRV